MIAPEVRKASRRETDRLVLLRNNLLLTALIFFGLQLWRSHFFLTDDNLDGGLSFFNEVGRHLLSGRSPFYSDYLFGGHYNLLRDPSYFVWNPIYLIVSLLAGTPLRLWIIDADAFLLFLLSTAGFVNLAWYLRRELALKLSDGWLMFFTASFTYSMIALTTATSWLTFLGNQSALPWLALGILQRSWWRGGALVALFSVHQLLGGHPEPIVSSSIFLSIFAVGVSWIRRSYVPFASWAGGYTAALLAILPLLLPMLTGFFSSARSHGVDIVDMGTNNIGPSLFPVSFFFGTALWIIKTPEQPFTTYTLAMGTCAAAWWLVPALARPVKWRGLETLSLGLAVFIMVLIWRPHWINEIMIRLPLLKSMRWPFRELLQFQFFLHLFFLLRRPGFTPGIRKFTAIFGSCIMIIPLLLYKLPPTFNAMQMDRQLLFTGGFNRYWSQVRTLLSPKDRVAVLIPLELYEQNRFEEPYSLLPTFDYSCLAQVINTGGWSQTPPEDELYTRTIPHYPFGAYAPEQKAALMAERPELKFITLVSLKPLKITLSSKAGPTIDLTPYIPTDIRAWKDLKRTGLLGNIGQRD